jgi:hypothetical protein
MLEFLYFYNLRETEIWPLGDKRYTLNQILALFNNFKFKLVPTGNYSLCSKHSRTEFASHVETHVRQRVDELRNSYDGICLNCLHHDKTGSFPQDYWNQPFISNYSEGCEIEHGEPTWYFSWILRAEDREEWQRKLRESRDQQRGEQLL